MFAELKDPVRHKIERYGLTRTIDPHHFFPTIAAAISAFRDETGTQWVAEPQAVDGQATQGQPPADSGLAPRHSRHTTGRLGRSGYPLGPLSTTCGDDGAALGLVATSTPLRSDGKSGGRGIRTHEEAHAP